MATIITIADAITYINRTRSDYTDVAFGLVINSLRKSQGIRDEFSDDKIKRLYNHLYVFPGDDPFTNVEAAKKSIKTFVKDANEVISSFIRDAKYFKGTNMKEMDASCYKTRKSVIRVALFLGVDLSFFLRGDSTDSKDRDVDACIQLATLIDSSFNNDLLPYFQAKQKVEYTGEKLQHTCALLSISSNPTLLSNIKEMYFNNKEALLALYPTDSVWKRMKVSREKEANAADEPAAKRQKIPTPVEPKPVKPTPALPKPVEPTPALPKPVEPKPVQVKPPVQIKPVDFDIGKKPDAKKQQASPLVSAQEFVESIASLFTSFNCTKYSALQLKAICDVLKIKVSDSDDQGFLCALIKSHFASVGFHAFDHLLQADRDLINKKIIEIVDTVVDGKSMCSKLTIDRINEIVGGHVKAAGVKVTTNTRKDKWCEYYNKFMKGELVSDVDQQKLNAIREVEHDFERKSPPKQLEQPKYHVISDLAAVLKTQPDFENNFLLCKELISQILKSCSKVTSEDVIKVLNVVSGNLKVNKPADVIRGLKEVQCYILSKIAEAKNPNYTGQLVYVQDMFEPNLQLKKVGTESAYGDVFFANLKNQTTPLAIMKYAKDAKKTKTVEVVHEIAVGLALNNMMEQRQEFYFSYTYGGFFCPGKFIDSNKSIGCLREAKDNITAISLQQFVNGKPMLDVLGKFDNKDAEKDANVIITHRFKTCCKLLFMLAHALNTAQQELKFMHYDLHYSNLMVREYASGQFEKIICKGKSYSFEFQAEWAPVLIDYGMNACTVDGVFLPNDFKPSKWKDGDEATTRASNMGWNKDAYFFAFLDFWKFFGHLLDELAIYADDNNKDMLTDNQINTLLHMVYAPFRTQVDEWKQDNVWKTMVPSPLLRECIECGVSPKGNFNRYRSIVNQQCNKEIDEDSVQHGAARDTKFFNCMTMDTYTKRFMNIMRDNGVFNVTSKGDDSEEEKKKKLLGLALIEKEKKKGKDGDGDGGDEKAKGKARKVVEADDKATEPISCSLTKSYANYAFDNDVKMPLDVDQTLIKYRKAIAELTKPPMKTVYTNSIEEGWKTPENFSGKPQWKTLWKDESSGVYPLRNKLRNTAGEAIAQSMSYCMQPTLNQNKQHPLNNSTVGLKPEQFATVEHLMSNRMRGVIAFHEVGTGKTVVGVASTMCFLAKYPNGKVIWVTPASVSEQAKNSFTKFNIDLKSFGDKIAFYTIDGMSNAVSSNGVDAVCPPKGKTPTLVVVDEAHNLKNLEGSKSMNVQQCANNAAKVLLLTATPVVNDLMDIFTLLALIDPECAKYAAFASFEKLEAYLHDVEKRNVMDLLGCRVSFFQEPQERLKDYPTKHVQIEVIEMDRDTQKDYQKQEDLQFSEERKPDVAYGHLRQFSNVAQKFKIVIDKLSSIKPSDRIVIYSQYLTGIKPIRDWIISQKTPIRYRTIEGKITNKAERIAIANEFNKPHSDTSAVQVLFITKAGAEGLDLKRTTDIFIMEPYYNEARHKQIIGRGVRFQSHADVDNKTVNVKYLWLVKPKEAKLLKTLGVYHNGKELRYVDKDGKDKFFTKEVLEQNKNALDDKLSVDLYTHVTSNEKQRKLDKMIALLKKVSIENLWCL